MRTYTTVSACCEHATTYAAKSRDDVDSVRSTLTSMQLFHARFVVWFDRSEELLNDARLGQVRIATRWSSPPRHLPVADLV
jgi:hypothetical protein